MVLAGSGCRIQPERDAALHLRAVQPISSGFARGYSSWWGENVMFSMSWGSGSRRRPAGPVANVIKLVAGTALVVFMGVSIGPALSAAQGHGTRGFFVAQTESCGRHGCTWTGKFRLPDGQGACKVPSRVAG